MATRKLLIAGATGNQGKATIDALLSRSSPFDILALTRKTSSKGAQSIPSKPNVTVVQGDIATPAPIFSAHRPIYGVFCVTFVSKEGVEEAQAKPLIDESIKNGVQHFVFTSVERGGPAESDRSPTNVPHFATKFRIEEYLKEQIESAKSKMQWTILRPVAFMDNLSPGTMGKGFADMWKSLGDKPLQVISSRDIGIFAARAFEDPNAYKGRAISLAGDELTFNQAKKVFKETMGYDMPENFAIVGMVIQFLVKNAMKDMGMMIDFMKEPGFGADIKALRMEEPQLQNLSQWLKESSTFSKQ